MTRPLSRWLCAGAVGAALSAGVAVPASVVNAAEPVASTPSVAGTFSVNKVALLTQASRATGTQNVPAEVPLRVMPLGDSITYGSGSLTSDSYRVDLGRRLAAAGMNVDFVGSMRSGSGPDQDHEGHPGWGIDQITAGVLGWLDTYQPDVVLLLIGINDLNQGLDVGHAPARLSSLIDTIRSARPQAEIFVQKIVASKSIAIQARIASYNAAIPSVVAAKDRHMHVVDQSMVGSRMLSDKLHPNDYGYGYMSYNIYRAMKKVYNSSRPAWPLGVNPEAITRPWLCFRPTTILDGTTTYLTGWDCAIWVRRRVTSRVGGRIVSKLIWQRQR